jgi:hypothetical protein
MAPPLSRAGTKRWASGRLLEEWATVFRIIPQFGVEKEAGLRGVFDEDNPFKRTKEDMTNRLMDIFTQTAELERQFGIPFPLPPVGLWCQRH